MSIQKQTSAIKKAGTTPITEDSANTLAELVLQKLDKVDYRGGRAIEYRESSNGGVVRISRDEGGRIHFRTPSAQTVVRLSADRSNRLLSHDNRRKLEGFLNRNPGVLSFLERGRIR